MPDLKKHTQKRGFNLVEAAIVLGVVGLVIGGIWTAASSMQQQRIFNQLVTGMLAINANIRKLYVGQDTTGYIRLDLNPDILPSILSGVEGYKISPVLLGGDTYMIDPTGARQSVRIDDSSIVYDMHFPDVANCIKLISMISANAKHELREMNVGSSAYVTFPVIPTAVDCAVGGYVNVWFKF